MNNASLHETHASTFADEILALFTLCQQQQSDKDGREKPSPEQYSRDEDILPFVSVPHAGTPYSCAGMFR